MPVPTSAFTVRDHPSWRCSGAALGFVIVLTLCVGAAAQAPPPAVRSPEVHADRRVTFRLRAPAAARVELVGEVLQGQQPQAMTKGADGVWTDAFWAKIPSDRWRVSLRFLVATVTLAILYLAIEEAWLWGSQQVMYTGWTTYDPAQQYAEQAVAIAEQSKAREAKLNAHQDRTVFELGIQYGYVSNSLFFGDAPEGQISAIARRALDRNPRGDMQTNAQRLGPRRGSAIKSG